MKKWIDHIAKRVFTVSGFVTSAIILLIIGFLFTEAVGLFNNPIVEDGYTLVVNKENPIKSLSSQQIKDLFDEEIVNWKELGGSDIPVQTFRLEDLSKHYSEEELGSEYEYAGKKIGDLIRRNQGMIAFVPQNLIQNEPDIRMLEDRDIPAKDVLLGTEWYPTATPSPIFGDITFIVRNSLG